MEHGCTGEQIQVIGFHVGEERYALPTTVVREVIAAPRITRVPRAPPHVAGVINLRGNIVPVFDLAIRLLQHGKAQASTPCLCPPWVVIAEHDDELVGIGAARVTKVLRIPRDAVTPVPPVLSRVPSEYLSGVARLADGFLVLLRLDSILAAQSDGAWPIEAPAGGAG